MSYYNELFIEENNKLIHIGSCLGSDSPNYFDNVTSIKEWNEQLKELKKENGFYPHSDEHPFPWKTYKTSDHLIVLKKSKRKWFEVWKPSYEVLISVDKNDIKSDTKCFFTKLENWYGNEEYDDNQKVILDLPKFNTQKILTN